MQKAIKVLVSADSSLNATGLGKYSYNLCKGLHEDENYEVAELANFGHNRDRNLVQWKYYGVEPSDNQQEILQYTQDPENRYGKWKFESTLLDFKPDFVVAINDPWMFSYQGKSPYRQYYHWVISPTVDSYPQREDYLSIYSLADSIITYTDWALDVLDSYNMPNLSKTIRMGVDCEIFKPVEDKAVLKEKFGIPKDAFIIGSIMRNQTRKLLPNLIESFNLFLDSCTEEEKKKTFLYLHTTYPDIECWDIPRFILESKYSNQILFTYKCKTTGEFGCSRYQDARTYSFLSNGITSVLPSGRDGLSNQQLSEVVNLFDLYVQLASCEGFGVPIIEAAACGIPCAVVDYSAMGDAADNLDLFKITGFDLHHDNINGCRRAKINNEEFANELCLFRRSLEVNSIDYDLANRAKEKYSWKKCIELWKKVLSRDRLVNKLAWNSPRKEIKIKKQYPSYLSNSELLEWLYDNFNPDAAYRYGLQSLSILRHLHYGVVDGKNPQKFDRDRVFELFTKLAQNINQYEQKRK